MSTEELAQLVDLLEKYKQDHGAGLRDSEWFDLRRVIKSISTDLVMWRVLQKSGV